MIYKINLALTFLGSGKIRLQNEPRFLVSWLGKNSFTKRIFSAILSQAKVFNVILWGDKDTETYRSLMKTNNVF